MLSAVCFGAVSVGSIACGSDATVFLAPLDDLTADPTEARIELVGTGLVRVVAVAPVFMLVDLALEDVDCALECGELAAAVLELDSQLAKSGSCGRASLTHMPSRQAVRRTLVLGASVEPRSVT